MEKSRSLGPVLGHLNGRYFNSAMIRTVYELATFSKMDFLLDRYAAGMAAANATLATAPTTLGGQIFASTNLKPPRYNSCTNLKYVHMNLPYCCIYRNYAYWSGNFYWDRAFWRDPQWVGDVTTALPFSDWLSLYNVRKLAWGNMQPRFEGDISLINTLFEMKDFRFLAKHALKYDYRGISAFFWTLKRNLARTSANIRALLKRSASSRFPEFEAARVVSRVASELWLTKTMCIDPTISDALAIHAQMAEIVIDKQREFYDRGQTRQASHFSYTLKEEQMLTQTADNNYRYKTGTHYKTVYNATHSYLYDYAMRNHIDALLQYWGMSLTPEALWNMIPLSFVIDYFIGVGDSFHAMKRDPNVTVRGSQMCESVLVSARGGRFTSGNASVVGWVVNGHYLPGSTALYQLAGYDSSAYRRHSVQPSDFKGAPLPQLKLPSWTQGANLVALVRCFL